MNHSTADLIDIVYHYYPQGTMPDDLYKETVEYRRLVAARRQAGAEREPWSALLRRVKEQFPENSVHDGSLHLPTGGCDACYSGRIILPTIPGEHHHTVEFLVSFVVPYYIVYCTRCVDDIEATKAYRVSQDRTVGVFVDDTCFILPAEVVKPEFRQKDERVLRRTETRFDMTPEEQPYAAWIAQNIESTFGYAPMPPEIGNVIVPDVETNLRPPGEARLYDCLFLDSW